MQTYRIRYFAAKRAAASMAKNGLEPSGLERYAEVADFFRLYLNTLVVVDFFFTLN